MILSGDIDDQRILQSDWTRGRNGHVQWKMLPSLDGCFHERKEGVLIDSFQRDWWSNNIGIWLVARILGLNWRIRFPKELFFVWNHKNHCYIPFLG